MTTATTGLTCFFCGYDLRGRAREDVCPECGRRVSESMGEDRLDWADRRWLGRVRVGTLVAGGEYLAPVVGLGVGILLPWLASDGLALITILTMGLCAALGAWMVSAAEPGKPRGWQSLKLTGMLSFPFYIVFVILIMTHARVMPWHKYFMGALVLLGATRGIDEVVIVRRLLKRRPTGGVLWPTWVAFALVAGMWGAMLLGVTTDLLDRQYLVLMVLLPGGCLAAVGLSACAWLGLRLPDRREMTDDVAGREQY